MLINLALFLFVWLCSNFEIFNSLFFHLLRYFLLKAVFLFLIYLKTFSDCFVIFCFWFTFTCKTVPAKVSSANSIKNQPKCTTGNIYENGNSNLYHLMTVIRSGFYVELPRQKPILKALWSLKTVKSFHFSHEKRKQKLRTLQ